MKITKKVAIPVADVYDFLKEKEGADIHIEKFDDAFDRYIFRITEEITEPIFNIQNLHDIAHDNELTMEQQNAIDYGISAIKTLIDMGVIK